MIRANIFFLILLPLVVAGNAYAQNSQVICYNSKSKSLTIQSSCTNGSTLINGSNIAATLGLATAGGTGQSSGAFKSCTTATGANKGTNYNGEVGVAVSCSKGVMISRSFDTVDTTNSNPTLKSETILKNKSNLPVGTQIVMKGKQNGFYTVNLKVDCCS